MIIKVEYFFSKKSQENNPLKHVIASIIKFFINITSVQQMEAARLVIVFVFLIASKSFSQEIQWASEVVDQSHQFIKSKYSSNKILGKPDAGPYGQKSKNAFVINTDEGDGIVTLGFENPQQVSQIIIVENYFPGQVRQVSLSDIEGNRYIIYAAPIKIMNRPFNVLVIKIDKTPYKVQKVSLRLNAFMNNGSSQIDAVGICDGDCEEEVISGISARGIPESDTSGFQVTIERLGDNVNTMFSESKPVITPDGEKLFFVRKNTPDNIGKKKDDQDIYFSELIDGKWSMAQNIGSPLNDKLPNGICSVSPDGNTLMVINAYYEDGFVEKGVSVSRKTESGWSLPKKQDIDDYYNISGFEDYFQSNSGEVLISAVQRSDSKGSQDLYVSFRTGDNSWSIPENLGVVINTNKEEFAPFLASDNKTLYFASNGHPGFGESDIFYSRRLDDSWTNWSTPTNVGETINSDAWEGYYTISGKGDYAYFVSTAKKIHNGEIAPKNEDIYRISLANEAKPGSVVLINETETNSEAK